VSKGLNLCRGACFLKTGEEGGMRKNARDLNLQASNEKNVEGIGKEGREEGSEGNMSQ